MNNAATTDAGPETFPARRPSMKSQLIPRIIKQLEDSPGRLMILDCGYGVPETIAFFSDRLCRLHFGGFQELYGAISDTDMTAAKDESEREAAWYAMFRKEMNYPVGTQFDLCLFWDMFSYLDNAALRAFTRALSPFVNTDTLGHAFAALSSNSPLPHRGYGLLDADQLSLRPGEAAGAKTYPRPQATLARELNNFKVGRSVLHQGSLLEMSLVVTE